MRVREWEMSLSSQVKVGLFLSVDVKTHKTQNTTMPSSAQCAMSSFFLVGFVEKSKTT